MIDWQNALNYAPSCCATFLDHTAVNQVQWYGWSRDHKRTSSAQSGDRCLKLRSSGGATGYASWATAYPVAQHSLTNNTCIYIKKNLHVRILPCRAHSGLGYRRQAAANCCLWRPASHGHVPCLSTAQSSADAQERQGIVQVSKIHICYLLCKISNNSFFHCSVYM